MLARDERVDLFPLDARKEARAAVLAKLGPAGRLSPGVVKARAEVESANAAHAAARDAYLSVKRRVEECQREGANRLGLNEVELETAAQAREARVRSLKAEALEARRKLIAAEERVTVAIRARRAASEAFLRDFHKGVEPVVRQLQGELDAAVEKLKAADLAAAKYAEAHEIMTSAKELLGIEREEIGTPRRVFLESGERMSRSYVVDSDTPEHEEKRALEALRELHVAPPPVVLEPQRA